MEKGFTRLRIGRELLKACFKNDNAFISGAAIVFNSCHPE
jgi:hypothetical protein